MQERTRIVNPTFGSVGDLTGRTDKRTADAIEKAIHHGVEESYRRCPMRHRTGAEDARRVNLCLGLYVQAMGNELPLHRVTDCMANLLCLILDGCAVEFSEEGQMWCVPDSGVTYIVPSDAPDINEEALQTDLDIEQRLLAAADQNEKAL